MAEIGSPAVTLPIKGTWITPCCSISLSLLLSKISIARGFVGSRRISPLLSKRAKWPCTVELDAKPTASPISRTDGG